MLAPKPKNLSFCHNLHLKIHRLKVHFIKSKMSGLTVCNFLPLDGAHCIKFNFSDGSILEKKNLSHYDSIRDKYRDTIERIH